MKPAKIGDLLKAQPGIVYQPYGGGFGHQGFLFDGHRLFLSRARLSTSSLRSIV